MDGPRREPGACDFVLGKPQKMPLPGFVSALERQTEPLGKDWFAYKFSEPNAKDVVATALRECITCLSRGGRRPRAAHSSVTTGTAIVSWSTASGAPGPLIDATTAGRSPAGTWAVPSTSISRPN